MDTGVASPVVLNGVLVDLDAGILRNALGEVVPLRAQSFAVLRRLLADLGRVVSRDDLVTAVWKDIAVTDDSLIQCIADIRRALGDTGHAVLQTVPRRGYRLVAGQAATAAATGSRRRPWPAAVALVAVALAFLAAYRWHAPPPPAPGPEVPVVAVLPFAETGNGGGPGGAGEGVTEDLVTMLARSPDVLVLSRGGFADATRATGDLLAAARRLGADYVLEGSVRHEGDRMRLTAELVDVATGAHLWAERFDEAGADPWALQDRIAGRVLASLVAEEGALIRADFRAAWAKDAARLNEYDYFLRGLDLYVKAETPEELDRAGAVWMEGLARFPESDLLKIKVAWYHWAAAWDWFTGDIDAHFREADRLVREVLATDYLSPEVRRLANWLDAFVALWRRDFGHAAAQAKVAVEIAPYDMRMLRSLTEVMAVTGEVETGLDWLDRSVERGGGTEAGYQVRLSWLLRLAGRNEEAVAAYARIGEPRVWPRLNAAIAEVRLGRLDAARARVAEALREQPDFTQAMWREVAIYADPAVVEGEIADLALAGLPPG
jgi:TolB-like protein/DNA-binding winged helix-turn-helix (wHTH) protein